MSVEDAVLNFSRKQLKSETKSNKKNKSPEKDVEKECMNWFNTNGFSMNVVESKAVFNQSAGRYLTGQTITGFLDSAGCTPSGYGCFVEFKAKKKLSTLRQRQRIFMREKILKGCFSCVVDGAELLQENYQAWNVLGKEDRVGYLLSIIPKQRLKVDLDLNL